jgi:hypothetical protein
MHSERLMAKKDQETKFGLGFSFLELTMNPFTFYLLTNNLVECY